MAKGFVCRLLKERKGEMKRGFTGDKREGETTKGNS